MTHHINFIVTEQSSFDRTLIRPYKKPKFRTKEKRQQLTTDLKKKET